MYLYTLSATGTKHLLISIFHRIVRIPLKVKTPTFFLLIYNKLSSLVIGGRDMSVKFPEQFNVALEGKFN